MLCESFYNLEFDPKLSLGDILGSLTTLLVAVLVVSFLEKRGQSDRTEKELLLRQLDAIAQLVKEFEKFKDGGVLTEITAAHKRLAVACDSVRKILVRLKYPRPVLNKASFEALLREIRKLATETPIGQIENHARSADCDSTVREGIITLAAEKRARLDSKIEEMKLRVFEAQIVINRI